MQQAVLTDKSPTLKATITELIDESESLSQKMLMLEINPYVWCAKKSRRKIISLYLRYD